MREDIDKCNAAGMTAVSCKPIAINKLLVLMEDSVEAGRGRPNNRTELNLDPESDDDFTTVAAIADPKKARASWKTLSAYIRALQAFVSHHDTTLDDLRQYLAERPRKDTDALSLLHALRGAASNLQLSTIADASQQLETVIRAENYDRQQELFTHLKCAVDKAFTAIGKLASFDDSGPKNLEITQDPLMIEPLFKKLFAALDELDPELADPILKDLRRYLTKSDLAGIENALGTFDFGKAKDAAAALIQQFKLQPSPAR
jgi:HPt (histidine-containing phosphotransfer) domain-containing protein